METKRIVIVGGGITGLTAAYYLQKENPKMNVTLLEQSGDLGGKMHTVHHDGHIIERGADSFLARKKPGMRLMDELGLTDRLIRNQTGQAYVLVQDQLHSIPAGSYMGIPIEEGPFMASDLLTSSGKERVLKEKAIPKGVPTETESLGRFLRRRFGDELVENVLEPLLSGIYSSDIDQMDLMSTFPNFYELEQQYGSILRGLRETMPERRKGTGQKSGQFVALPHGMDDITAALVRAIGEPTIQTGKEVQKINGGEERYTLQTTDGSLYEADRVLLALPHKHVPELFSERTVLLQPLKHIPVSSVANVALGFDADNVNNHLDGTGFVVSRNSAFRITACTWTDRKWPHTTPDGKVLFRLYVGKPSDQDIVTLPDEDIVSIVLNDMRQIMTITGDPDFAVVSRWPKRMPQYTAEHQHIVSQARETLQQELPGIFLAGSFYDGVGIPDCIASAEKAVQQIQSSL